MTDECIQSTHIEAAAKMKASVASDDSQLTFLKKRLKDKVRVDAEKGCWIYQGCRDRDGYAPASLNGKSICAHQLSFMLHAGFTKWEDMKQVDERGKRLLIRHTCNNRPCCNPEHLQQGTDRENVEDKSRDHTQPQGEYCNLSKFTNEQVQQIIDSRFPAGHPKFLEISERARLHGVSVSSVRDIDFGRSWKSLPRNLTEEKTVSEETAKQIIASHFPQGHAQYQDRTRRAAKFNTTPVIISNIDQGIFWKQLPRPTVELSPIPSPVVILGKRDRELSGEEKVIEAIIASKRHRADPQYQNQTERAKSLGVSVKLVYKVDSGKVGAHLTRPKLDHGSKIWTLEIAEKNFEHIKTYCTESTENNIHTKSQCLLWTSPQWIGTKDGRPRLKINGRQTFAAVFAAEFGQKRQKVEGELTRHLCGNCKCCNPEHLVFGTAEENAQDVLRHGNHKGRKVTPDQVREIRKGVADGVAPLARKFFQDKYNLDASTIGYIVNRVTWKNVA